MYPFYFVIVFNCILWKRWRWSFST